LKLLILACVLVFLVILLWPVDNDNISKADPIRVIAGTSIEPPRTDWGYTSDYCSVRICNI